MGGPCEFKLYAQSPSQANHISEVLQNEVRRIESKYSRYDSSSVISSINSAAGKNKPVKIDEETFGLLNYAHQLHEQSDGLFDITSGVLRKAWNFKSGKLPNKNKIKAILPLIDWSAVTYDKNQITLPKKGMEIDFGGFGKEYTTDICAIKAQEMGVSGGIINLGGDLRVLGPHPDGKPWVIGIQHPRKPTVPIARIDLNQGAIATSGDYERFMIINGVRYSHLLNPKTGMSIQPRYASVSVITESCLVAGSFSTLGMLHSVDQPEWIKKAGLAYLTIDQALKTAGSINT